MSAGRGRLRVGTASWTDPTLVKETQWYPRRSMSAEARLRHYASVFPLVEVDATYYHPPTPELAGLWVQRTPDDFVMDVKAYSLLTMHPTTPRSLWADVVADLPAEHVGKRNVYLEHLPEPAVERAFAHVADALRPLDSAGKLGAVFFQFPKWFVARRANRRYLESLPDRLPGYQLAVEFRHRSWLDDDTAGATLRLLEERGLAFVCVDGPQGFASSVPPLVTATADLAVVRFHGHNRDTWEAKGITAAERFRYLYSTEELAAWAPKILDLAATARETHLVMNNCYRDYGVRNARELGELLGDGLAS
ncbi:MAG: DUF72 domain-containing protein [Actinomycetota bacterium]|nr:DUF72 domain-containing protein [Actinomycetota bacterium]